MIATNLGRYKMQYCLSAVLNFMLLAAISMHVAVAAGEAKPESNAGGVESVRISAVGDIMLGTTFPEHGDYLAPDDGASLLKPMYDAIRWGDVRFGNLEGPMVDGGDTKKCSRAGNCYAFRMPTRYAGYLKEAGFTVMSIANNHAADFGDEGIESTKAALDSVGIKWSGPKGTYALLDVRGIKIGFVAFHTSDHTNDVREPETAYRLIKRVNEQADLVIVSFHGGAEGSNADRIKDETEFLGNEDRGNVVQFAHRVVDAGADLVLGHGPHVLRAMELYRGRLIAYSLGNFCTYGRFNLRGKMGIAGVLQAELDKTGRLVRAWFVPAVQKGRGGPVLDPEGNALKELARLARLDFPYTGLVPRNNGSLSLPPTPGNGFFTMKSPEKRKKLKEMLAGLESKSRGRLTKEKLASWFGDERAGYLEEVVEKLSRPAEKRLSFAKYRNLFINKERIEEGKAFLKAHSKLLEEAEKEYGVDMPALAAVIAVETRYGRHKGKYRAFNSLASIAIGYPRRSAWAEQELLDLLLMYKDQDPLEQLGSYAGAIGYPQFMPSNIRRFGVDADRDGKVDLNTWPDAVMSCANYLKHYGWRTGGSLKRGSRNYRAVLKYNPSHHYARVVTELTAIFARHVKDSRTRTQ